MRQARDRAGLTAVDLAAKAGVSPSTVTRVEQGTMNPTVQMLERLLSAAGVDVVIEVRERRPTPTLEGLRARAGLIREIVARHGGSNVRVAGSVGRGDASPESDVDLVVDVRPGMGLFKLAAMEDELRDALPWSVDVLTPGAARGRMSDLLHDAVPL